MTSYIHVHPDDNRFWSGATLKHLRSGYLGLQQMVEDDEKFLESLANHPALHQALGQYYTAVKPRFEAFNPGEMAEAMKLLVEAVKDSGEQIGAEHAACICGLLEGHRLFASWFVNSDYWSENPQE